MSAQHAPLTKQPRRPGRPKHDSATTREVLLDTAEQMFATLGVEGASMRAISMAAGLTHTAVNYHYRTKPLLLAAVLRRRGEEVGRRFAERLQELEDTGRKPTAQELVQALLVPHVDVIRHDPVGGLHWLRIVARLLLERDPHLVGYLPAGLRDCLWRLLQRTYPRVPDALLQTIWSLCAATLVQMLGNFDVAIAQTSARSRSEAITTYVDVLARFAASGFAELVADRALTKALTTLDLGTSPKLSRRSPRAAHRNGTGPLT